MLLLFSVLVNKKKCFRKQTNFFEHSGMLTFFNMYIFLQLIVYFKVTIKEC